MTTAYLVNRCPSSAIDFKTPEVLLNHLTCLTLGSLDVQHMNIKGKEKYTLDLLNVYS